MFFLIRSAVCIGAVALLVTGGGNAGLGRVLDTDGRDVAQSLGQACIASSGCLRIGMGLVATAARADPDQRAVSLEKSADTLTASDLGPAWIAPRGRRASVAAHPHPGTLARL